MKKALFSLILFFLSISNISAHTSHYKGIKVIKRKLKIKNNISIEEK